MNDYLPEGRKAKDSPDHLTESLIKKYILDGTVLEAPVIKSDAGHNLYVRLGRYTGFMPHDETVLGIKDGSVKEIAVISRVNKPVCFRITGIKDDTPILSRAAVQRECLEHILNDLTPGDVIPATVTHIEPFGAFVDIGCGICSLIPIDAVSISRISHPSQRFYVGQKIYAAIKETDKNEGRVFLTHKELLGTWEENAGRFDTGQTVTGIIRSLESYGTFIELTPNLAGLADAQSGLTPGQTAAVFIKSIVPEKMKIKLNVISADREQSSPTPLEYFIKSGKISKWDYSPAVCKRKIYSEF